MSAVAVVPQDKAGLSGLVARKAPHGGVQDDDPDADFGAALAQTADASPATATPAATRVKGGDNIWRTLAAISDEAKAPQRAAGDLPADATAEAVAAPALKPAPMATEFLDTHDARLPAKPDMLADAASVAPPRAESPNAERVSRAPDKTTAKAPSTIERAAPQAEATASIPLPSNPPTACASLALPSMPAEESDSASSGPSIDKDAVARIGAALAPRGAQGAASDPGLAAKFSEEASEGTTTSVHVVAQQTWLQPVSPIFSPGLRRQAAADRAALETPQAAGGEVPAGGKIENRGKVEVTGRDAPDAATKSPGQSGNPAPEKTPQSPSSAPCSPSGGNFASDRSEAVNPAAAVASPSDESARGLAAAPRKNLEITLSSRELGGLEVRMKSAGDRLELAFVADRGETARLISDKSAALTSQLHGAGIGLGGVEISAATSGQGASGGAPTGGGRQPNPSGGDSNPAPQRQQTSGRDRQDGDNEIDDQNGDAPSRGQRGFYL